MIRRVVGRAEEGQECRSRKVCLKFYPEGLAPDFDRIPRRGPKNRLKTTNIHKLGWINEE